MSIFDRWKKKNSDENNRKSELLEKHEKGEIDDAEFLRAFGKEVVYYSTPFGDHKDGGHRLFLLPGPNGTGYNPVFSSVEWLKEFYENAGRAAYMIIEGSFTSFLETLKATNEGNVPVKMGTVIDPYHYNVSVDVAMLDKVIEMTKQ